MDTASLSPSRQLSAYREWPDGRKGCLFYLVDPSASADNWAVICLLDSPVRMHDKPGDHDSLHHSELPLAYANVLLRGYAAFLIGNGWIECRLDDLPQWWTAYCQCCDQASSNHETSPRRRLVQECEYWLDRHRVVLMDYLHYLTPQAYDLEITFLSTIQYVSDQLGYSMHTLMWDMESVIQPQPPQPDDDSYLFYLPQANGIFVQGLSSPDGLIGFQAHVINYLAASYACHRLRSAHDADEAAVWICLTNGINRMTPRLRITFSDLMPLIQTLDTQALFSCYTKRKKELLYDQLCGTREYYEHDIDETVFNQLVQSEVEQYKRGIPFAQYVPKPFSRFLHLLASDYLRSLLFPDFASMDVDIEPPLSNTVAEPVAEPVDQPDLSIFRTDKFTAEDCEQHLREEIIRAKNKADACKRLLLLDTIGYLALSALTDEEKALRVNTWTRHRFLFTKDDFRKARNKR